MKHPQLTEILTDLRSALKQEYGTRLIKLILFGSQSRGDARSDSDIDVLVILDGSVDDIAEIKRTSQILSDLCLQYATLVSCVFISTEQMEEAGTGFFRNVNREGTSA